MLYSVIRDYPSLYQKVKRLISVWRDRNVIEPATLLQYDDIVNQAMDDYHTNKDRRLQPESPKEDAPLDEPEEDPSLSSIDSFSFHPNPEYDELDMDEAIQRLSNQLVVSGRQLRQAEEIVDYNRCEVALNSNLNLVIPLSWLGVVRECLQSGVQRGSEKPRREQRAPPRGQADYLYHSSITGSFIDR